MTVSDRQDITFILQMRKQRYIRVTQGSLGSSEPPSLEADVTDVITVHCEMHTWPLWPTLLSFCLRQVYGDLPALCAVLRKFSEGF